MPEDQNECQDGYGEPSLLAKKEELHRERLYSARMGEIRGNLAFHMTQDGVVLVVGEDPFLAADAVADAVGARTPTRLRGGESKLAAALDEVRTPSLFGDGRCVVLLDGDSLLDTEGLDALANYAEHPAPDSLLVVQAKKVDGRKAGAKRLKAAAEWIAVQVPPEWKLVEWTAARARSSHGLAAGGDAIRALVECVGGDLGAIEGALIRLKEQIAPRTDLRREDVLQSTEDHRSPALFEASNAVESRDLSRALEAVDAAFREGLRLRSETVSEPQGIALILIGQIHSAYRKLLRFGMLRRDSNDADAARAVGVSPKAARFFLERARKHQVDQLIARHSCFLLADRSLKKGDFSPRQAVERLLVSLLS